LELPFLPLQKAYGLVTGLYGCAFGIFATVARELLSEQMLLEFLSVPLLYPVFIGKCFHRLRGADP
jgi:hypothetical protein